MPVVSMVPAEMVNKASLNTPKIVYPMVIAPVKVFADRAGEFTVAEIDIAAAEMLHGSSFAELGIDSLLSLTIIRRLREEMRVDLVSTLFLDHGTDGSIRACLHKMNAASHLEPER